MTINEEWRPISGYEGFYEVSNLGRVRSLDRSVNGKFEGSHNKIKGKLLKLAISTHGYLNAALRKNGACKTIKAHRLVALSFIPNPKNKICVNHIDGNRKNNVVSNLEWCTHSENVIHGLKRRSVRSNSCKLNTEKVRLIRDLYHRKDNIGKPKPFSCNWLGRCFGVSESNIEKIVKNKTWIMGVGDD